MDVTKAYSPYSHFVYLDDRIKINIPLSCWYHIHQMAEKRADYSPFQLPSDNPKDDDNRLHGEVDVTGGPFKCGSVSC